jgi:hypothetical protein
MLPTDWYSVSVHIAGPTVDPNALTKEFGVEPTWQRLPDSRASVGAWVIDTKDHVVGNRLIEHLAWLRSRLGAQRTRLQALGEAGLAHLSIRGAPDSWDFDGCNPDSELDLGLRLEFVVFRKGPTSIRVDDVRYVDE